MRQVFTAVFQYIQAVLYVRSRASVSHSLFHPLVFSSAMTEKRKDHLPCHIIFSKPGSQWRSDRSAPVRIIKCSPSSPALENTGLNGLHKCVFCSFLVAYCSDLSYLHCTLAHLFIQIPMFNAFPYVLRMIRDSGCLIRCLYVFSYILFFTGFEIHSGFSC